MLNAYTAAYQTRLSPSSEEIGPSVTEAYREAVGTQRSISELEVGTSTFNLPSIYSPINPTDHLYVCDGSASDAKGCTAASALLTARWPHQIRNSACNFFTNIF